MMAAISLSLSSVISFGSFPPLFVEQLVKRSVMQNHTPQNLLKRVFMLIVHQPRYPVRTPRTTWKSLSPPRGLQLFPSCQAQCPVKTSTENISAPIYSIISSWKEEEFLAQVLIKKKTESTYSQLHLISSLGQFLFYRRVGTVTRHHTEGSLLK